MGCGSVVLLWGEQSGLEYRWLIPASSCTELKEILMFSLKINFFKMSDFIYRLALKNFCKYKIDKEDTEDYTCTQGNYINLLSCVRLLPKMLADY